MNVMKIVDAMNVGQNMEYFVQNVKYFYVKIAAVILNHVQNVLNCIVMIAANLKIIKDVHSVQNVSHGGKRIVLQVIFAVNVEVVEKMHIFALNVIKDFVMNVQDLYVRNAVILSVRCVVICNFVKPVK